MNFASFPYLLFLILSIFIYFSLPNKLRAGFLLLASYFFYAIFGFGFAILLFLTTSVTFISSYYCYRAQTKLLQRVFFFTGILLDLAVFILFKYIHIIDIDLMNWPNLSVEKMLIPIGISFYTFKTIGYCIDIYRRKYEPESSFIHYALAVSFFPQLIAGPIEKAVVISTQIKQQTKFNIENCIEGGKLILWGLFKKIVIADSIAQIVNPVFNNIHDYGGIDFVVCLFAFTYQVYADFSGYSDIAIGSAKCFCVNLPANFNKPFFSKSYRDFWIRWHITFSKWLKEYVFDALGGISRTNSVKTLFNLAIVFLIVGFWHGATINFMAYAGLAFVFILIDVVTNRFRKRLFPSGKNKNITIKVLNYFLMIFMVSTLCIFFRPVLFSNSVYILANIFSCHYPFITSLNILQLFVLILFFEVVQYFQSTPVGHCFQEIKNFYIRVGLYITFTFMLILLSSRPDITFQYFQF